MKTILLTLLFLKQNMRKGVLRHCEVVSRGMTPLTFPTRAEVVYEVSDELCSLLGSKVLALVDNAD